MSDRAVEFLDRWEADHVEAVPFEKRDNEAIRLAEQCRQDALRAGISLVYLEKAANGNLVRNMLDAIEEASRL
jgi:hypothetical protein